MNIPAAPQIGDFGLMSGKSLFSLAIRTITGKPGAPWTHAVVVVGPGRTDNEVEIVEAMPRQGVLRRYADVSEFVWSTGGPLDSQMTPEIRTRIAGAAEAMVGEPYDFGNILAFVIRAVCGRDIRDRGALSMICSRLVVTALRSAGVDVLDTIPAAAIAPADLGFLLPA